jgi:hypothetical protein
MPLGDVGLRLAAEAITPSTTLSAIRDEALKKNPLLHYLRIGLKPARTLAEELRLFPSRKVCAFVEPCCSG